MKGLPFFPLFTPASLFPAAHVHVLHFSPDHCALTGLTDGPTPYFIFFFSLSSFVVVYRVIYITINRSLHKQSSA